MRKNPRKRSYGYAEDIHKRAKKQEHKLNLSHAANFGFSHTAAARVRAPDTHS